VRHICGLTFGIATGLAALAGGLVAPLFHVAPPMGTEPLLITFIVVILGGLGSIMGALIVSFMIGFQQCFMAAYWGSEYTITASFALAMLVLIFRPTGLMGHE
jgi:branched-chain amino acid transport system permease protein